MKTPLDKIIKEHFQQKRFDLREGDWASMQQLIQESAHATKRRKTLLWLPALLLLTTSASIWFWYPKTEKMHVKDKQKSAAAVAKSAVSNQGAFIAKNNFITDNNYVQQELAISSNSTEIEAAKRNRVGNQSHGYQSTEPALIIAIPEPEVQEDRGVAATEESQEVLQEANSEPLFEATMSDNSAQEHLFTLGIKNQPEILELELSKYVTIKKSIKYPNYYPNLLSIYLGGNNTYAVESSKLKSAEMETEKPTQYIQGGVQYAWQRRFLSWSAGVQYSEFTSKNSYKTEDISYTYTSYLRLVNPNFSVSSSGNPIALVKRVVDTTTTVSTRYIVENQLSKMQYIHLPLSVSVARHWHRMHVQAGMGLSPGFLVGRSGWYSVAGTSGKAKAVDLSTYLGMRRLIWTGSYQIGVGYSITNHWQLAARYDVTRGVSSVFKDFSETMKTQSLSFGLGYGF